MEIKYHANDGKVFDTADECRAHEEMLAFAPLIGLDEARLALAMQRHPDAIDIADALEKAGARIAKQRREAGELKRERRAKGEAETAQEEPMTAEETKQFAEELVGGMLNHPRIGGALAGAEDRTEGMPF